MSRRGRSAVLLGVLAIPGCAPAPGPTPAASAVALTLAAAEVAQAARSAKEREEHLDSTQEAHRPGEALLGEWGVTTTERLPLIDDYRSRIAAGEVISTGKEGDRIRKLISRSALVKVYRSHIEFHRRLKPVVSREYDVLRDTGREVEFQLCGGEGERAVATIRGEDRLHVAGLVGLTGGDIWLLYPGPRD